MPVNLVIKLIIMKQKQPNISGLHHIAIRAIDFDQTLKFYTEALGYTVSHSWSLPQFNLKRAAMLRSADGHSFIELFDNEADIAAQGRKNKPGEEYVQTALLHLCLGVENAEEAYHYAIAAGATSCIEPMSLELGDPGVKVKNALVFSPNGEVIEFLEKGEF